MYPRYVVDVEFIVNDVHVSIFKRRFKSLTNAIKVCASFDSSCLIYCYDDVLDKDVPITMFIDEFKESI